MRAAIKHCCYLPEFFSGTEFKNSHYTRHHLGRLYINRV